VPAEHATAAAPPERRPAPRLRPGERAAVAWSFAYFFALLCGYYLLRPIREEMGIRGGVERLHLSFTATFAVMLAAVPAYAALLARVPRSRAIPVVYRFFLLNLGAFAALLHAGVAPAWVARAFFVWVSVYNLFVVSVFWSYMADVFTSEQGRRVFGLVAAGGTAGALVGPALAALLVGPLGVAGLLVVSGALLEVSARCATRLGRAGTGTPASARLARPVGGGLFAGIALLLRSRYLAALALQTLFVTATSTLVYFQQARVVADRLHDPAARTRLFAAVDLAVNALGLGLQALVTGPLLTRAGLAVALALHPLLTAGGLVAIAWSPTLPVLAAVQSLRRAVHYAIERPAREVLFTVVGPEEKYKAKSVLDTVVYRGGDAASAWVAAALAGAGIAAAAVASAPIAGAWVAVAIWLARRHRWMEARHEAA
jgi:AAA family ATP:ADP antiporter